MESHQSCRARSRLQFAALELGQVSRRSSEVAMEEDSASFEADAEQTMSREHTL